jgi:hypothetical protein
VNDKVLLPGANFERVPSGTGARLERDQVLMTKLGKQILNGR